MKKKFKAIGKDVRINKKAVIRRPQLVTIGDHVAIDEFVVIATAAEIGNWIHIGPQTSVIGGKEGKLIMEDFTTISAGCRLICSSDDFTHGTGFINPFVPKKFRSLHKKAPIIMKKHSALGTNVIVFPGVTIGTGAVVGAGSIVTKSLKPWTVNLGNPAKEIGVRPRKKILEYEKRVTNS